MSFFSTLKQLAFPMGKQEEEAQDLEQVVTADKEVLSGIPVASSPHKSTLSPFASRILEKAKREALKDDDERKRITSPAELFLSSEEAKIRIDNIKSNVLERSKRAVDRFTGAAKAMPETKFNAFAKKAEKDEE